MRRALFLLLAVALHGACAERGPVHPASADAALPAVVSPAAVQATPLTFTMDVEPSVDGGLVSLPLVHGERPRIAPTQTLHLTSNLPLSNYRIRVFDEVDRAMVSDDLAEDAGRPLSYRVRFERPLKRGHRYTIVIDGQAGPLFSDATGKTHPEHRYTFEVEGPREQPKPEPKRRRRN